MRTIPQLFVGGELVGGCTDTLDAWRNGRLQAMLEAAHTGFDRAADVDPYAFLPRWLQPR
jgi:cysteine synthase A